MPKLRDFCRKSNWHSVFNFEDDGGSARSNLLFATISQTAINGLTTGVFYSGYLGSFDINIVSISILTLMPYVTSFLSVFTPVILERFKKRKVVLSVSRIIYYAINVLGPTILPLVVENQQGRLAGLVVLVFSANAINALFASGYSAWHMGYIAPEIRSAYMTATKLISTAVSGMLLLGLGMITDRVEGQSRQVLLAVFRCLAFLIALLDIYFLQKPKEPEYMSSARTRVSLSSAMKIPLSNRRFMLIMAVYLLHTIICNLISTVVNTWLLEEVKVSYAYISFINMTQIFFMLPTSTFWGKCMRKRGVFGTLALAEALNGAALFAHAFMTDSNYLWVMAIVKLIQNCLGLGMTISVDSLIYIALPEEDQTSYLSAYQIIGNLALLLGMSIGTWVVAAMGDKALTAFGFRFTSVPVLLLIQSVLFLILPIFICWVGRKIEPE